MMKIFNDTAYANELRSKGWLHAQEFTQQKCAAAVIDVYKKV
jgi:hypothetical protein